MAGLARTLRGGESRAVRSCGPLLCQADTPALSQGRHNTLIELRNDLIATPQAQGAWADRLAPLLVQALARVG